MFISTHDDGEKTTASDRTRAREAFFLEFARAIRDKFPDVPLMVTGGFRTRQGMEAAVAEGVCDLVGLGRPAVLNPSLPSNLVFNPEVKDDDARLFVKKISPPWIAAWIAPSVGAGAESVSCLFSPFRSSGKYSHLQGCLKTHTSRPLEMVLCAHRRDGQRQSVSGLGRLE